MQIVAIFLLLVSYHANVFGDEADTQPIITANVKQLQRPAPEPSEAMPLMRIANVPPPATLPAERLPQYRIGYQRADTMLQSQVTDAAVRFVLTDPMILQYAGRPLLIEAKILIDSEPFSSVRDQLAATHLAASTESVSLEPESSDTATEPVEGEAAPVIEENDQEPVSPATEPPYHLTSDSQELLRRYAEAVGEKLEEAEAGWLMTHWTDGPTLLVLHPYFQNFRAEQRPAFVVLDKDRDGILSKTELEEAAESFRRCDANRDDIVDVLEIARAAQGLRDLSKTNETSAPLFWLLSDLIGITEKDPIAYQSIAAFDTNQNGQIEVAEIDQLSQQTPDIQLSIAFDSGAVASSKLHVTSVNQERNITVQSDPSGEGVNASIGNLTIHLSAIQSATSQSHTGQTSIGAVVDGYPLLPELDPNGDGRFTIRELRTLTQRLRAMDRNGDQALSQDECLSPIRVCIGFGPIVHEELANMRTVLPTTPIETISGPEWFVRMDRNQDGDLTRDEFPGTDEQFAALDADGDSLISASEANEFDKRTD